MTINLKVPDLTELKPRITVFGVGGAGGNAVNNMINSGLEGVEFVVANTDAQALTQSRAERRVQMGTRMTEGLGAGSKPEIGAAAAEEAIADLKTHLIASHMVFITAGMGGGTGTGAAPVIARAAKEEEILTVGVVTKPFQFEGQRRLAVAEAGIAELEKYVDTMIVIPNQNLFRVATEKTTFADAFALADQVLHSGVACITDLMVKEGLINLDFADVKAVMAGMGKAMMGTGISSGEQRSLDAAEAAISNPLLDDVSMRGAKGVLISITGGSDLTLYEVDEAASRIREEVAEEANIILGATFDESLDGRIRVSVVAAGLDGLAAAKAPPQKAPATQPKPMEAPAAAESPRPSPNLLERIGDLDSRKMAENAEPKRHAPQSPAARVQVGADEVTIEKRPAQVPIRRAKEAENEASAKPADGAFVPQPPTSVKRAAPRMPSVNDLPAVAQKEIRAKEGASPEVGLAAQKRKIGFFERLTGGGKAEKNIDNKELQKNEPNLDGSLERPAGPPRPKPNLAPVDAKSEEERKVAPMPGQRRPAAGQKPVDDDELEIPAFLRRQAN